jgi:hypothetical protein
MSALRLPVGVIVALLAAGGCGKTWHGDGVELRAAAFR